MAFKGLFIGIDRYASPEINWLSCASRDATALHALFTDTLGGETRLLTDERATVAAIEESLGSLPPVALRMLSSSLSRGMARRRTNWSGMTPIPMISQERRYRLQRWAANGVQVYRRGVS